MHSLRELQHLFLRGLAAPGSVELAACIEPGARGPESGVDCYRTNATATWRKTLLAVYPVIERLVGPVCFAHAADRYATTHPSVAGDLNRFGRRFPGFLRRHGPTRTVACLPAVARLEWLLEECFHAGEAQPFDVRAIAAIAPGALGSLRIRLHPATRLMASRHPVLDIWMANQPHRDGTCTLPPRPASTFVLVRRDRLAAVAEPIDRASFRMLRWLAAGHAFGAAFAAATRVDATFDVAAFLRRHVADGVLARAVMPRGQGTRAAM